MKSIPFKIGDLVVIDSNYTYHDAQNKIGVVVRGGFNAALVQSPGLKERWISKEYLEIVSESR